MTKTGSDSTSSSGSHHNHQQHGYPHPSSNDAAMVAHRASDGGAKMTYKERSLQKIPCGFCGALISRHHLKTHQSRRVCVEARKDFDPSNLPSSSVPGFGVMSHHDARGNQGIQQPILPNPSSVFVTGAATTVPAPMTTGPSMIPNRPSPMQIVQQPSYLTKATCPELVPTASGYYSLYYPGMQEGLLAASTTSMDPLVADSVPTIGGATYRQRCLQKVICDLCGAQVNRQHLKTHQSRQICKNARTGESSLTNSSFHEQYHQQQQQQQLQQLQQQYPDQSLHEPEQQELGEPEQQDSQEHQQPQSQQQEQLQRAGLSSMMMDSFPMEVKNEDFTVDGIVSL